jgi:hypothetical protein
MQGQRNDIGIMTTGYKMVNFSGSVFSRFDSLSNWVSEGYAKIELIIPEKNFSKFYEGREDTGSLLWVALVYAIHGVTRQIIDDPVIQDYILCR